MLRQVVRKAAACGQVPHQQVRWHLIADEVQRRMQCLLHSDHWAALRVFVSHYHHGKLVGAGTFC